MRRQLNKYGDRIMKTTTAKVSRPDGQNKFIPNAINFKGYLSSIRKVGVGEAHECGAINAYGEGESWEEYDKYVDVNIPFFNSEKLKSLNLLDKAKKVLTTKTTIEEVIETEFEPALLKWGENEFGYKVVDSEEEKRREVIEKKEVIFTSHHCWETGLIYYQLIGRYPEDVFKAMKLEYHNEQFEEEGEWKGWYTMSLEEVNERLKKIGWTCK
jgi:hypothetical protein